MHELDRITHSTDRFNNSSENSGIGRIMAVAIKDARAVSSVHNPELLLCLGAGQGYPELELIEALEIPYQNVTLLDRQFSTTVKDRLTKAAPEATLIESGMFSYLESAKGKHFSLVTAFGLHDVITKETVDEFLRLITGVTDSSAIVFIQHKILPTIVIETVKRHGFVPLLSGPFLFTLSHTSTAEV